MSNQKNERVRPEKTRSRITVLGWAVVATAHLAIIAVTARIFFHLMPGGERWVPAVLSLVVALNVIAAVTPFFAPCANSVSFCRWLRAIGLLGDVGSNR